MIHHVFLVIVFNLILHCPVFSKYLEGHIVTYENWVFVSRFCFSSQRGQFRYLIEYPANRGPLNLLLYYDNDDQWPAVYKTNTTCEEKESIPWANRSQIVPLSLDYPEIGGCKRTDFLPVKNPSKIITCNKTSGFISARQRWWYIAVSKCSGSQGINFRYKFLMTNGDEDDYWHYHFSADEFYVLPILVAFLLSYIFVMVAMIMCSIELKALQFLHATYKLFMTSVILEKMGIIFQAIHYACYANNGIGYLFIKELGRIFESISEFCFLVLMLLLAKGYTVTRARLPLASSVKLTIFLCCYVVCTFALFMYEKLHFDPGEVLYLYESPAGYGVISLRLISWWMFIYSTGFTLKHHPGKSTFYYPFNLIGTIWFVATPVFVLAANNLIDKWVRESVVCGAIHAIAFGGHIFFLVLTMPSKANKNFPYHVRTNQIGIMEDTGDSGNNTVYNFGHHTYAPGGLQNRPVPIDLFTVSKAVEIGSPVNCEANQQTGYIQTILVPFTIRDSDSEPTTPPGTPKQIPTGSQSATFVRAAKILDNRQIVSAGGLRKEEPSAPYEDDDIEMKRPETASTVSAHTAENFKKEEALSLRKLTDMFVAQSYKTAI